MLSLTEKAEEETETRHREPEKDAAMERREAIAAEITAMLVEQAVADTTVKATEKGITITLSNIQFLADSARLHLSEMAKLQDIANILKNIYGIKIEVSGHTALAGTEESRLNISRERAQVVASYLVLLGACAEEDISYIGYGATRPIADNSTEEGMALNRRVEIILLEN
jgi:outer membrane protein OmpA-like peptidoglycan-associated protein